MKINHLKNKLFNNNTGANDIDTLNMLITEPTVTFNYKPDPRNRRIDFYYEDDKVLIEGLADNNCTFWLSKTDISDTTINAQICQHILHDSFDVFFSTNKYYKELHNLFKKSIYQQSDCSDVRWQTPFGAYIGDNDDTGLLIAKSLVRYKNEIDNLCEAREDGGNYISVMTSILEHISVRTDDPVLDYSNAAPWIKIMENESYLLCSKNEQIRGLFLQIKNQCENLYNSYMTAVR